MQRIKKIKSTNDGFVKHYMHQTSNTRFGTLDKPAHFTPNVDYTVNHIFEIMTTTEINTLTQHCETERTQFLTILSLAQPNRFMAGCPLIGNRKNCSYRRCFAVDISMPALTFTSKYS